jgi:hypothetical protein
MPERANMSAAAGSANLLPQRFPSVGRKLNGKVIPMSTRRKLSEAAGRKKPRRPKTKPAGQSSAGNDACASRRGAPQGERLPQRCTPAEKRAALEALAARHGVRPIDDPSAMIAAFWPPDESAEEIVTAIRSLRREGE